jgi:beta-galactosidase GanA
LIRSAPPGIAGTIQDQTRETITMRFRTATASPDMKSLETRSISRRLLAAGGLFAVLAGLCSTSAPGRDQTKPIPGIVNKDGRYALLVDGAPFLILGAQCHNSSAWPALLPKVWPAIDTLHANTLEIPIYWEQFEPEPGKYDPSIVDLIIGQAREHKVRLVLLWFATWKNGSSHYIPLWAKAQPEKFPLLTGKNGERVDSPSPHSPTALQADLSAFRAFMRHLKQVDAQRTVIMVQVENEPGSWGSVRDYSPVAERLFGEPVPRELLKGLGTSAPAGANWTTAFGPNADEYFQAWSVARFVGQVAAAGKQEYPLPMYANAALRDPLAPGPANTYESGGPTDNVLGIWKAAAPALDVLAPDIYQNESVRYRKVLELYARPDNALFVPETGGPAGYPRLCFAALGRGAIGWSPFGLDYTSYSTEPQGAPRMAEEALAPIVLNYKMLEPMMREVARLNFEGRLQAIAEEPGQARQTIDFGTWKAVITFGAGGRNNSTNGNTTPIGRALVAKLGENEFLVAGVYGKIDFTPSAGRKRSFQRVEEGSYEDGVFKALRIWNGDETDYGLSFFSAPQILRVVLGTY